MWVRPSSVRACGTSLVRWMALQCANPTASRLAKRIVYEIRLIAIREVSPPFGEGTAFVCLCHRAASFTYFGEVLRCPHKRIVTITKVYIARNIIHVETIRFHTN